MLSMQMFIASLEGWAEIPQLPRLRITRIQVGLLLLLTEPIIWNSLFSKLWLKCCRKFHSGPWTVLLLGGGKEDLEQSKKRSIKRKHLYKTIEQNLNNINVSETDRKCEVRKSVKMTFLVPVLLPDRDSLYEIGCRNRRCEVRAMERQKGSALLWSSC